VKQLALLTSKDPEWGSAWNHFPDKEEENNYQVWQYMNSLYIEEEQRWVHEFRHRCHPSTNDRMIRRIPATENWQPTEIFT
jgi:hypothetical protein